MYVVPGGCNLLIALVADNLAVDARSYVARGARVSLLSSPFVARFHT